MQHKIQNLKNILAEITDLNNTIALLEWDQRTYMPQELVKKVTGSGIDPSPYLRYLEDKFGKIYGL